MPCKYCDGSGFMKRPSTLGTKSGATVAFEKAFPCLCTLNPSINAKYKHLEGMADVISEDMIMVGNRFKFKNMIFYGNEAKFLYLVKCFVALHSISNRIFSIIDGLELVHNNYTEDGDSRGIYALEEFDLLVLLCVSKPPNKAIKEVIFEVINNRLRRNKPCWLYGTNPDSFIKSQEYSPALQEIMDNRKCSTYNCDVVDPNFIFKNKEIAEKAQEFEKANVDKAHNLGDSFTV